MDRLCHVPPSHLAEDCRVADIEYGVRTATPYLGAGSAEQGERILGIVRRLKRQIAGKIFLRSRDGASGKEGCIVALASQDTHVRYALPASDIIAPNLVN